MWGKGELKLSKQVMTEVMMYMFGAANPKYSDGANKKNKPTSSCKTSA